MPETAKRTARVPILGEDGRISDDYIPAAIGESVTKAESAATRAETAAAGAEGSASAASQSATQASGSASAASASASQAQQSATTAGGAATSAQSAKTAAEAAQSAAAGSAQDAQQSATDAQQSATDAQQSATDAQQSATDAQQSAASVADKYITSAQATTLAPGSQATASVADQVLTIGVPKGEKGDTPTVGIGEVTTLAPGEHATATVTETDTGVNINLGIPQGERGEAATAISYVDGEYVGLGERFAAMRDARVYGVTVHMDGGTVCEKTQDNVGIGNPVPSTLAQPGSDPYAQLPAFYHRDVCGYPDAQGVPHVTSMDGDGIFRRDGSTGAVCVMVPPLFWSLTYDTPTVEGASEAYLRVSNTPLPGLRPMPEGVLPDGTLRPYGLIPKYALGLLDGKYTSASGLQPVTRTISHDSLVDLLSPQNSENGTSWSGMSRLARWYVQVMFLLKYANRDSQTIMRGCTQYDYTQTVSAATDAAPYVDVADASSLVEGSSVMVGTENTDRNDATAHDVVDYAVVTSIAGNRLNLDRDVTVASGNFVKTAPWMTGACDGLQGDGSPTSNTSGKEPYVIQGVETALGMYEVMSGVALHNDGTNGWRVMVYQDGQSDVKDVPGSYEDTGVSLPTDSTDSWKYPLNLVDAGGVLVGTDTGGSTTTGLCDGEYTNPITTVADREFRSGGGLWDWGSAGPSCVGVDGLGYAWWSFGSRLSATRSSGGEAAAAAASRDYQRRAGVGAFPS